MNQPVTSASAIAALPTATSGPSATTANGNTNGAGSGTILLPHPSPSLSAQAAGQIVRAVVVGPTADGKVIVDTLFGKYALSLDINPPPGTVLQLQIVKSGAPVELLLLGSGGRTPASQTSPLLILPQPPPALLTLTKGELFRGVVVNPSVDGKTVVDTRFGSLSLQLANAPANGSTLQLQIAKTGTPLELRLVSTEPPAPGHLSAAKGATILGVGETVSGRFVPTAGSAAAAPGGLVAGTFHARIVAIHPTAPATATAGNEAVVIGRVASSQPGGPTVIETATGRIVLPATGSGTVGQHVTLQILAEPGTVLPTNPDTAHLRSLMSLSHNWTALAEAIDTVRAGDPQIAAQFTAGAVPNTGATLTAGIALFLAILTRGRLSEWLGPDVMRLLESSHHHALLRDLDDDFNRFVRLAGEPTNTDWRVAMLPLLHEGILEQIRLYLRKRRSDGDSADENLGTRFVIEASLSRLGNIQLDGLVRRSRFDLMVRTQAPLPRTMRLDIEALFDNANQQFGVRGTIKFQVLPRFPVDPVDELSEHAVGVYA